MSLDVTFGTSGTGSAPPSPSGHAGAAGAKPTASDLATLFAALLANGTQASSALPGKAAKPAAAPSTEEPTRESSRSPDPPDDDPHDDLNQTPAGLTTLLMALTAPQNTLQTITNKPLPPTPSVANRVGDTAEITKLTTQEAMDTVPAPGPSAPGAKADPTDGGLLPLSLNLSAALSEPVSVDTPAPTQALPFQGVLDPKAGASAFAMPTPAIPIQMKPQAVTVSGIPVLGAPAVSLAASLPPTALSFNDIRPDAPVLPGTPTQAVPQSAPSLNAAVLTPAQTAVLVQTALQNEPQPANNTGMPTPKANAATVKTTGAVHATLAASVADTVGKASTGSASVSETPRQDKDAEKLTAQAAVDETVLAENAAALTMSAPTSSGPQSASASLTPADRASVMQQISDGAQQMTQQPVANGVREINLQLHPHDWGQIKLSVRMTPTVGEDGAVGTSVIAHIVADNPTVKAALETHTAELRQTLQEAGMKLDQLSVTVQAPDAAAQSGTASQEQRPFSQDGGAWTGSGASTPGAGTFGADQTGSGAGFSGGFSSGFSEGSGGQTHRQPSPSPTAAWTEDAGTPETTPSANNSARLPMGRWDSRA